MSLPAPYQEHYYIGNGSTVEFPFGSDFTALAEANVKCIIYFDDGTSCVPTFTVNMGAGSITIVTLTKPDGTVLTVPPVGSVVRVFRETPEQQNVTASQLQNYTAKQLEKIFDSIVAMIQENGYTAEHKTLRLTETQRDLSLQKLGEDEDQCLLYWDEETGTIKSTEYTQDGIKSDVERANSVADEAKSIAQTTQANLSTHVGNSNNPHQTSLEKLTDTKIEDLTAGQFLQFDGLHWKNVYSSAVVYWGGILGTLTDQTDLMNKFAEYVRTDGTSVMTAPLLMRATGSFKCAIAPCWDGVGFFKLNNDDSVTLMASMEEIDGLTPATNNKYNLGKLVYRWKNLYLSGTAYMTKINNGFDIAVPVTNSADTLALKSQVDDAANSGEQLYTTGVWYAKMYAATVVPTGAEYDGRNYADFSQVDSDNNPVIKVYTGASGAWTLTETITPPKNHNGYMTITSKIWDIAEQSGQQGGQVLWSHNQNTFTPYPRIVSFESVNITGNSTVDMPLNPTGNSIVNKDFVENALLNHGTGRNVGDVFWTMRTDSSLNGSVECNGSTYNTTDFSGAHNIGQLLEDGKIPYVSLATYATLLSTNGAVGVFGWDGAGTTAFRVPSLNDIFIETGTAAQIGDYLPAGLPNITGKMAGEGVNSDANPAQGCFRGERDDDYGANQNGYGKARNYFDASRSSSIYGNSTTVQPKSVRYRAMVQLAISASDQAVETCTQVLSDVAGLKDANNFTATGKANIANLCMPNYAAGVEVQNATTTSGSYTATSNGQFMLDILAGPNTTTFKINNIAVGQQKATTTGAFNATYNVFVKAGDSITWTCGASVTMKAYFYPMTGI